MWLALGSAGDNRSQTLSRFHRNGKVPRDARSRYSLFPTVTRRWPRFRNRPGTAKHAILSSHSVSTPFYTNAVLCEYP